MKVNIILFLLFIFSLSCSLESFIEDSYGLRTIDLDIDSSDLSKLRLGLYNETKIIAHLRSQDIERKVKLQQSGASTRDDFKRNYSLEILNDNFLGFKSIRLHGDSTDPSGLKTMLAYSMFAKVGFSVPAIEPVWLQINGVLKGLYFMIEPLNEDFFTRRLWDLRQVYKLKLNSADFSMQYARFPEKVYDIKGGSLGYEPLKSLIESLNDPAKQSCHEHWTSDWLHLDQFIDYMAVSLIIRNRDGINNNFYIYQLQDEGHKFGVLPWDMDLILKGYISNNAFVEDIDRWHTSYFFSSILNCYQDKLVMRVGEFIKSPLSLDAITVLLEDISQKIAKAYELDPIFSTQTREEALAKYASLLNEWYSHLEEHTKLSEPNK